MERAGDTIVAVATGGLGLWDAEQPRATRVLVRVSGPGAEAAGTRLLEDARFEHRRSWCTRARLGGEAGATVACVCWCGRGPGTFTGEDVLEVVLPANRSVVERAMAVLVGAGEAGPSGVRPAGPGEFSARAYLNGKLGLEQAEGIAALIGARSEAEARGAERLMQGATGAMYAAWLDEVAGVLALVEAGIDFTDQEDVVPIEGPRLRERLMGVRAAIAVMLGAEASREAEGEATRAVLVGKPSAGKSTLFNALLGRERAVVSAEEGTTRDAVVERLPAGSEAGNGHAPSVVIIDLPGLEEVGANAGGAAGMAAQARAREEIGRADVLVWCDPAGRFDESELEGSGRNAASVVVRVQTKADVFPDGGAGERVCALDGWRVEAVRRAIVDAGERAAGVEGEARAWLPARHRGTLRRVVAAIDGALQGSSEERVLAHPEVVAGELRRGLDALGELAGQIPPDEVIGRIFATFCVGK